MIAVALAVLLAAAPPPSYVAERLIEVNGQTRRLSVFRDGTAVAALTRSPGAAPEVVSLKLDRIELASLAQVVEACHRELSAIQAMPSIPGAGVLEVRLAPPGVEPLVLRLPFSAVAPHGLGRFNQAMDGIETRVTTARPGQESFAGWMPALGQRLALDDGRVVEVVELLTASGVPLVRVQVVDDPVSLFLSIEELRRRAVRRIRQ